MNTAEKSTAPAFYVVEAAGGKFLSREARPLKARTLAGAKRDATGGQTVHLSHRCGLFDCSSVHIGTAVDSEGRLTNVVASKTWDGWRDYDI